MIVLADNFSIGVSTAFESIAQVGKALVNHLPKPRMPTPGEMEHLSRQYTFPGTTGTVDGSHIPILKYLSCSENIKINIGATSSSTAWH